MAEAKTSSRGRRVPLGQIVATSNALSSVERRDIDAALERHASGDWDDVSPDDRAANEAALRDGARLFSVYRHAGPTTIWIITEADRSATTVLLPEDY